MSRLRLMLVTLAVLVAPSTTTTAFVANAAQTPAVASIGAAIHAYDGVTYNASARVASASSPAVEQEAQPARRAAVPRPGPSPLALVVAAEGGETVQLFRHVDPTELADIRATGEFGLGPNSTGKYFAESAEHAERWGAWVNGGEGAVVETSVPRSFADQLMRWEKLDAIGPARLVEPGQIDWLNRLMNGIREVP